MEANLSVGSGISGSAPTPGFVRATRAPFRHRRVDLGGRSVGSHGGRDRPFPDAAPGGRPCRTGGGLEQGLLLGGRLPPVGRGQPGAFPQDHRSGGPQVAAPAGVSLGRRRGAPGGQRFGDGLARPLGGAAGAEGRRAAAQSREPAPRRPGDCAAGCRPHPAATGGPAAGSSVRGQIRSAPGPVRLPGDRAGPGRPRQPVFGQPGSGARQARHDQHDSPGMALPHGLPAGTPPHRIRSSEGPGPGGLAGVEILAGSRDWPGRARRGGTDRAPCRRGRFENRRLPGERLFLCSRAGLAGTDLPQRLGPADRVRGCRDREPGAAAHPGDRALAGPSGRRSPSRLPRAAGRWPLPAGSRLHRPSA